MKNTRKKYKTMIFFILGCLIIGGIFELGLYSFVVHQGNSGSPSLYLKGQTEQQPVDWKLISSRIGLWLD